jgi:hypothetical protein
MKLSIKLFLCVAVIMMFAIDATMVGSDTPTLGRKALAAQKLPNIIKINPMDVKMLNETTSFTQFKAAWKQASDKVAVVNTRMPQMQQKMTSLETKSNECKNKSYTAADMTAAGCTDDMPVSLCSVKLYRKCIYAEWSSADTLAKEIGGELGNTRDAVSSAQTSSKMFLADLESKMGL